MADEPLSDIDLREWEIEAMFPREPLEGWLSPPQARRLIAELWALREAVRARREAGNRAELIAANRRIDAILPAKQAETNSLDRGSGSGSGD